jgi:hypothetical protein
MSLKYSSVSGALCISVYSATGATPGKLLDNQPSTVGFSGELKRFPY